MTIFANTKNIFSQSKEYLVDVGSTLISLIISTLKVLVPVSEAPTMILFPFFLAFTILYAAFMSTIAPLLFIISAIAVDIIFSPFNVFQSLRRKRLKFKEDMEPEDINRLSSLKYPYYQFYGESESFNNQPIDKIIGKLDIEKLLEIPLLADEIITYAQANQIDTYHFVKKNKSEEQANAIIKRLFQNDGPNLLEELEYHKSIMDPISLTCQYYPPRTSGRYVQSLSKLYELGIRPEFNEKTLDEYFEARMKIYSVELKYHFDHNSARLGSTVFGDVHYGKERVYASANPFSNAEVPLFIPIPDDEKKRFFEAVKYLCDKPHTALFNYDTTILMIQDGHYDTYLRLAYGLKDPSITDQERALVNEAIALLKKPQDDITEDDYKVIFDLYECRSQLIGLQSALFDRLSIPQEILTKHNYHPRTQGLGWEKMTVEEHEHHQYEASTINLNSYAMNRIFDERKRLEEKEAGEFKRILTCAIPCMKHLLSRYEKDPNGPLVNQDISDLIERLKPIKLKEADTLANLLGNISNEKTHNIYQIRQEIERIENPSFMQHNP